MTLDDHLDHIRAAPRDCGVIELIVRRPQEGERELLDEAELDTERGLVGDRWLQRVPLRMHGQLTLMNVRAIAALAPREQWPLAGDQLFVDFDLSQTSLPGGTQLALGSAMIEISDVPHTGCAKFTARFGSEATRWVNTPLGRELRLRGVNARIIQSGTVRRGDELRRR